MEGLEKILEQIKEDNIVCPGPIEWNFFYKRIGGIKAEDKRKSRRVVAEFKNERSSKKYLQGHSFYH